MKSLFSLLVTYIFFTNIFGQIPIRDFSNIEKNGYVERNIHIFKDNLGDFSWIQDLHFVKGNFLYVIAYEPLPDEAKDGYASFWGKRKLFLYRKNMINIDNPWIVSSDTIMTNYYNDCNSGQDYREIRLTTKNFKYGDADVIQDGNDYDIVIGVHVFKCGYGLFSTGFYKFTLTPINEGFYGIKKGSITYTQKRL